MPDDRYGQMSSSTGAALLFAYDLGAAEALPEPLKRDLTRLKALRAHPACEGMCRVLEADHNGDEQADFGRVFLELLRGG